MTARVTYTRSAEAERVSLVLEEIEVHGEVIRFEITTSSGYRATLPACPCLRAPCLKKDGHSVPSAEGGKRKHDDSHCHAPFGMRHRDQAWRFAEQVLATYP